MKSAGKARNNGLYRHIRTSKEIIRNLLNDYSNNMNHIPKVYLIEFFCSKYFRTITRKSDWHIRTLQEFPRWQVIRGLKT